MRLMAYDSINQCNLNMCYYSDAELFLPLLIVLILDLGFIVINPLYGGDGWVRDHITFLDTVCYIMFLSLLSFFRKELRSVDPSKRGERVNDRFE